MLGVAARAVLLGLQKHFPRPTLTTLGFFILFFNFFSWLPALKHNFHVQDHTPSTPSAEGTDQSHGCITGRGTQPVLGDQDQEAKPGLRQPCRSSRLLHCILLLHAAPWLQLDSFPHRAGTGLPWREVGEEASQPHQCQQGACQKARVRQQQQGGGVRIHPEQNIQPQIGVSIQFPLYPTKGYKTPPAAMSDHCNQVYCADGWSRRRPAGLLGAHEEQ